MSELITMDALQIMASAVAKSGLFGVKTPDQALALMLVAQAEGLHPATAARDYHIIQGRPAMKADAMLARYLATGGRVEWHEHTDALVCATFSHPAGGTAKIDWTMERAKQAGLSGKDNWKAYPRQMLRARVISEGIRMTNPGVAIGVYTVEETQDFSPEKDMGRAEIVATEKRKRVVKAFHAPDADGVIEPTNEDHPNAQPKASTGQGATSPVTALQAEQPAPDAGPIVTRTETLKSLCELANVNMIDLLARAEVRSAEEMSDVDYEAAKESLGKRITRRTAGAGA